MDFIFEQNEVHAERRQFINRRSCFGQDLTFPEFMDIVLDLRGDNAATATRLDLNPTWTNYSSLAGFVANHASAAGDGCC